MALATALYVLVGGVVCLAIEAQDPIALAIWPIVLLGVIWERLAR